MSERQKPNGDKSRGRSRRRRTVEELTRRNVETMVRWLVEQGYDARGMDTEFEGEAGAEEAGA